METDEIVELVKQRGGYGSRDETRRVVSEVLLVVGSWDLGGEARNLAAQLPRGFGELLICPGGSAENLGDELFIDRIQERLGMPRQDARIAAGAVLSSMTEAVSQGEQADFISSLPPELSTYARWS